MGCSPSKTQVAVDLMKDQIHKCLQPKFGLRDPCNKRIVEWSPDSDDIKTDDDPPPPVPSYEDPNKKDEDPDLKDKEDNKTDVIKEPGKEKEEEKKDQPKEEQPEKVVEKKDDDKKEGSEGVSKPMPEPPAAPAPLVTNDDELNNRDIEEMDENSDDAPTPSNDGEEDADTESMVEMEDRTEKKIMGRVEKKFDFRPVVTEYVSATRPEVSPGELWVDEDFSLPIALQGLEAGNHYDPEYMQYRRPKELSSEPCLYGEDGMSRMDIIQGSVGTCYFLSVLQSIADQPEVMKEIIPENSYKIGTPEYDGIFHCRFWRFGHWEDVYIDDQIPSYPHTVWGAHNKNPNAMWVALMEKAFAKFHGSYKGCWSGHTGYSFMTLTGGTYEYLDQKKMKKRKKFYSRIKNALCGGSVVACSVPKNNDGRNGLIGEHAYSVTALMKIPYRAKIVSIIRVRNPWGKAKGEWNGAWSDGAKEWIDVDNDIKQTLKVKSEGDGEFWMSIKDYFKTFTSTTVCDFIPDADKDGNVDGLYKEHMIRGKWTDEELGEHATRLYGQKFVFEVPKNGDGEGAPVVLQLFQEVDDRKAEDVYLCIRADLFKVASENKDGEGGMSYLLSELTNDMVYSISECITYRYPHLAPGKYMVVPHYIRARGEQREFIVRIFANTDLNISLINDKRCFMDTINDGTSENPQTKELITMDVCKNFYGRWVAEKNAGGQIGHQSHDINPQYQLTLGGRNDQPCKITLVQEDANPLAIGFMLMNFDTGAKAPMTYRWIVNNERQLCVKDMKGAGLTFIRGGEASSTYMLKPGKYMLIIFTDKPKDERQYFLQFNTQKPVKFKEFNVCK